jgi:predicted O-methyltransferase YrrM
LYSPLQLAFKYLGHYLAAGNGRGHGIHSPFVFDFIKQVLNDRKEYACYRPIESRRERLLKEGRTIEVEDFGAGSSVLKSNRRKVADIARHSLKPRKYAQLLHRIVRHYQPASVLELGTSLGITTAYLAAGNEKATVHTAEGSAAIAAIAQEGFDELGISNIRTVTGNFSNTLPDLLARGLRPDMAFIDGNHRKAPTLQYFEWLLPQMGPDSFIVFDDIHWSREMEAAWEQIRRHGRVTLSIDLFFIGLVFFNPNFREKQDFRIRF